MTFLSIAFIVNAQNKLIVGAKGAFLTNDSKYSPLLTIAYRTNLTDHIAFQTAVGTAMVQRAAVRSCIDLRFDWITANQDDIVFVAPHISFSQMFGSFLTHETKPDFSSRSPCVKPFTFAAGSGVVLNFSHNKFYFPIVANFGYFSSYGKHENEVRCQTLKLATKSNRNIGQGVFYSIDLGVGYKF